MKTRRTSTKLVVAVVVLLVLGTTIAAVAQFGAPAVTRVRVCVKDNGQLRMLTGNRTTCDPSEQLMDWVVGGGVTEIRPGRGLVGSREGGAVQLALDPSIIAGGRGGRVFAGFNDGPGQLPFLVPATIAELDLPAGDYVIFAKLTFETSSDEFSFQRPVTCKLTAGADFDEARVVLETIHTESPGNTDGSNVMGLTLQVVHSFGAPGSVALSAVYGGTIPITPQVRYRDLKIMAIEASGISNIFLGGN